MPEERPELEFPACCVTCPHLQSVTASCTHELRQLIIHEVGSGQECPIYADTRADAMQQLSDSL